jgi:hypothetical protein
MQEEWSEFKRGDVETVFPLWRTAMRNLKMGQTIDPQT